MKLDGIRRIRIDPGQRTNRGLSAWVIFATIAAVLASALFFAWPRPEDSQRIVGKSPASAASPAPTPAPAPASAAAAAPSAATPAEGRPSAGATVLTTTGYIINRERIELSPRFLGTVKWIGVRKGDRVTKGQTVALLDDAELKARLAEADAAAARAEAASNIARTRFERARALRERDVQSKQEFDDAEAEVQTTAAALRQATANLELARVYLDWTVIKSPIDGVVLEKLADENELVSPQSFGGERSPSTALLAVADPTDLQVEIDLNEADLAKVSLNQKCAVSPEAFPERRYDGVVAEIAPEANRQKGTLQVKVQILGPDSYLIPELSAKVDFLAP